MKSTAFSKLFKCQIFCFSCFSDPFSNALIYDRPGFDVKKSQRFVNEPVRHKVLDLAGDLCLLGRPLRAFVLAVRAGHKLHVEFVRKVAEEMRKNA